MWRDIFGAVRRKISTLVVGVADGISDSLDPQVEDEPVMRYIADYKGPVDVPSGAPEKQKEESRELAVYARDLQEAEVKFALYKSGLHTPIRLDDKPLQAKLLVDGRKAPGA